MSLSVLIFYSIKFFEGIDIKNTHKTYETSIIILEAIWKLHGHIHIDELQAQFKYKH